MRKKEYKRGSEETTCVICGEEATRLNKLKQPVCRNHIDKMAEIYCPNCGMKMEIKQGKYGYFWGCNGFPLCDKTLSLRAALKFIKE